MHSYHALDANVSTYSFCYAQTRPKLVITMKQLLLAATTVALLLTYAAAMSPATVFTAPTECTGLTATPTPFAAPYPTSFYIDTGSNGQVIFVQATGDAITVAGDCSLEYDAERKRSIVLAPSGCCEIGIPLASDLDVFVNGDARQVYLGALLLEDASFRTDGFGSLSSKATLNVTGDLVVDANGKSRIMLLNKESTYGPTTVKVDGISDVALYGTFEDLTVERINGMSRLYVGAVEGNTEVELMDGFTQLRIDGSPGMKVTGSQQGSVNDIKIVMGTCKGPPRCTKVVKDEDFWPTWNDLELIG